jgi:hypothetical protein
MAYAGAALQLPVRVERRGPLHAKAQQQAIGGVEGAFFCMVAPQVVDGGDLRQACSAMTARKAGP